MSTTQNTAFVLVPGAFCPGKYYDKLVATLTKLDYTAIAINNPSSDGIREKGPGVYDDAAHVNKVIADLADQGKNVILVGNSYGGFVTTQAGQGLSKAERRADGGKSGGLIAVVLLASLIAPLGITCRELVFSESPAPSESEGEYMTPLDGRFAGSILCSEVDEKEQEYWGAMQQPQSALSMAQKLTFVSYEHYPTTSVVTLNDKTLRPAFQLENFDAAIAKGLKNLRKVEIEADHLAMISQPDKVAHILIEAAQAAQ